MNDQILSSGAKALIFSGLIGTAESRALPRIVLSFAHDCPDEASGAT
jgi:hypothetical protein